MGRRVRETDWAATDLGAYETWPQSLCSTLSLVLNAKGIAALYWGTDQRLLYNDAYGAALGDRHPAAFGRSMPEVLTDIGPVLGPQVAKVLRTGEGFAIENLSMRMRRHGRDEETIWTYSFSPVQGEDGGFAGVLLLATEMTRQKIAERSEKRTTARLESALRVAGLGTYEWNTSTGIVQMDARAREMFALPLDGPIRDSQVFARMAPDEVDRVQREAMAAFDLDGFFEDGNLPRKIDIDYDIVHPDGQRRSIASSGAVRQDPDGGRVMFGTFNDVSRLKQAEARLRRQNADLGEQVEQVTLDRDRIWQVSGDMLGIADEGGVWLSVNPAWTRILGWQADEIVGQTSEWIEHPDDVKKTRDEIGHLADGRTTFEFENRFRARDGGYRTLSWTAVPEGGRFYCVARDMTDARIHEEEVIARDAAHEVQTEALVDANRLIAQKERAEEQQRVLQREMAHRIKNTLSMVMAIVSQTMRHADSMEAASVTIGERINALSQAQDLLRQSTYASATIREVVAGALKVHLERPDRVTIVGEQLELPSQAALGLSLALHELATNATKYGALANDEGKITVEWRHEPDDGFRFEWREVGGPTTSVPKRQGFGSRLINRIVPSYFDGTGVMHYEPSGLHYVLEGTVQRAAV